MPSDQIYSDTDRLLNIEVSNYFNTHIKEFVGMGDKIRLAVNDDHPLMRQGIEQTLGGESDFEVLEGGSSAEDALRIANQ